MSAFYIWNPHINTTSQKNTVEMVVTNGDVSGIATDHDFIATLLKEANIDARPLKWLITPCRSMYYSDYLDEEDWQDIWQLVWKLEIELNQPITSTLPTTNIIPWISSDATGDEWLPMEDTMRTTCLLISDFNDNNSMKIAENSILNDSKSIEFQKRYELNKPRFTYTQVLGKYPQLQISIGTFDNNFYISGADYANFILEICKRYCGTINYNERQV